MGIPDFDSLLESIKEEESFEDIIGVTFPEEGKIKHLTPEQASKVLKHGVLSRAHGASEVSLPKDLSVTEIQKVLGSSNTSAGSWVLMLGHSLLLVNPKEGYILGSQNKARMLINRLRGETK